MSVLETLRLRLRPFRMSDLERAHEQFDQHPDVWRFDPGYPPNLDYRRRWLVYRVQEFESRGYGCWAVELRASNELIGACGLDRGASKAGGMQSVEIYYRLGRDYWSKGYATEAVSEVTRYAFDHLGVDRVTAHAAKGNTASISLLKRVGFTISPAPASNDNVLAVLRQPTPL